jgi:hypothetical protein
VSSGSTLPTFRANIRACNSVAVKVLCYKPDGREFETR